jgi:hypothetical protein
VFGGVDNFQTIISLLSRGRFSLRHNFMNGIDKSNQFYSSRHFNDFIPKHQKLQVSFFAPNKPFTHNPINLKILFSNSPTPNHQKQMIHPASAGVHTSQLLYTDIHPNRLSIRHLFASFVQIHCTRLPHSHKPDHDALILKSLKPDKILIMRKWQKVICPS